MIQDFPLKTDVAEETLAFVNIKGFSGAKDEDRKILDALITGRLASGAQGDISEADGPPRPLPYQCLAALFVVSVKEFYGRYAGFGGSISYCTKLRESLREHGMVRLLHSPRVISTCRHYNALFPRAFSCVIVNYCICSLVYLVKFMLQPLRAKMGASFRSMCSSGAAPVVPQLAKFVKHGINF